MKMKAFVEVGLNIIGNEVDPAICTKLLGVLPDRQFKKGDVWAIREDEICTHDSGLWQYSAEKHVKKIDPYDPLPLVRHIIRVFSGKKAQFDQIRESMGEGQKPNKKFKYPENLRYVTIKISIFWGVPHGSYTMDEKLLDTILEMGIDEIRYMFASVDYDE